MLEAEGGVPVVVELFSVSGAAQPDVLLLRERGAFLATKTEQRERDASWRQVQTSLERLRVDRVDLLKMNASDWASVWGDLAVQDVLDAGCSLVVLTDGARGARFVTRRYDVRVPAEPADPVDPTGAGDAFTAALLARLVHLPPERTPADVSEDELHAWGCAAAGWAACILAHRGAVTGYAAGREE